MTCKVRRECSRWVVILACVWGLGVGVGATAQQASTALQDYVAAPDPSFGYVVRQRLELGPCDVAELTLTSQTWRDMAWKHRLFLLVPDNVKPQTNALLVIEGGSWNKADEQPINSDDQGFPKEALLLSAYAQQLGRPIALLLNVPRQPIFDGRKEDAIIALTFDEYLKTGDTDWPLLLPMTKSAVRAMDAIQSFAQASLELDIDGFTVSGASKRGWTTWLTAAVDPRVKGLAPMVIDMLNMEAQFDHQLAAYGKFSDRIHDYTDRNLPARMRGEPGLALRQIVDPYSYRDRIVQPKLLVLGTNDGYWTVDALNLYWDALAGEKYVIYVPNADHDLARDWSRIMGGLDALVRHVASERPLPNLAWRHESNSAAGTVDLTVMPGQSDAQVTLWKATSPSRDFRKAQWTSEACPLGKEGQANITVSSEADRYVAFYADVVYPRSPLPLHLSTCIRVVEPTSGER